jgi:hypothetical protein
MQEMKKTSLTITLAGTEYDIREYTVEQVAGLWELVFAPQKPLTDAGRQPMDHALDVLTVALSVDHPEMTREKIAGLRVGTFQVLDKAAKQCQEFAGFVMVKPGEETPPGEAPGAPAP